LPSFFAVATNPLIVSGDNLLSVLAMSSLLLVDAKLVEDLPVYLPSNDGRFDGIALDYVRQ
jgi:hypothetical protein